MPSLASFWLFGPADPGPDSLFWCLVLAAATLTGGFSLFRQWRRRRSQARAIREAVAVPISTPADPPPVRPRPGATAAGPGR